MVSFHRDGKITISYLFHNDLSCYRFYDFMGIDFEMNQKPVTKKH